MKILALLLSLLSVFACTPKAAGPASAKTDTSVTSMPSTPAKSFVDAWDVTMSDTPLGTVKGVLTITDTGGKLGGSFVAQGQTYTITKAAATASGMTASFYYPEAQANVDVVLKGSPTADELTGTTMGDFKTVARRKG